MAGRRWLLCVVLIVTFSASASAASVPIIVQLSPNGNLGIVLSLINGTLVDSIAGANTFLVNVPQLPLLSPLLSLLGVQSIETNNGVALPNSSQLGLLEADGAADWFKLQPAMQLIRSAQALQYATGQGVVVADINSLVDYSHPALHGHLTGGFDFVASMSASETALNQSSSEFLDQSSSEFLDQSSSEFLDDSHLHFLDSIPLLGTTPAYGHGTLCAGLIAVTAPAAMIMPLRAFDDAGASDTFTLAKAIRYAANNGAHVINMSFGTLTNSNVLRSAIEYAAARNVIMVASAGNNNTSVAQYPAAYPGVIAVSATNLFDMKGTFSNYGSHIAVDGPGVNIISAYPGAMYSVVSGTSFSAPLVAASAALVRSLRTTGVHNAISAGTVSIDTRNPNYVGKLGTGRIDLLKVVRPYE
jgi:subtilisin family serine protease